MENYSGAIDYLVYKSESKYIVILLDNHNPILYCDEFNKSSQSNEFKNIATLFESFLNKDSVFILEELVEINSNDKIIELFSNTPHIKKYMEFYTKYKSNNNKIIPIDLRLHVDNFHKPNGFNLTDQLFGIITCTDPTILSILSVFESAKQISPEFDLHYSKLKEKWKGYIYKF